MASKPVVAAASCLMLLTAGLSTTAQAQRWHPYPAYEDGYDQGYDGGWSDGYRGGYDGGRAGGWRDGWSNGHRQGYEEAAEDYEGARVYSAPRRCGRGRGTAGLVIGGVAGALLGRSVAGDDTVGALLGGGAGALAGWAIERGQRRC